MSTDKNTPKKQTSREHTFNFTVFRQEKKEGKITNLRYKYIHLFLSSILYTLSLQYHYHRQTQVCG